MDSLSQAYRKYSKEDLESAVKWVLVHEWSIYKASKAFDIPWATLKRHVEKVSVQDLEEENFQFAMEKLGRPFSLPTEIEQQLFRYIIEMQELGFGLTVFRIRQLALQLANAAKVSVLLLIV